MCRATTSVLSHTELCGIACCSISKVKRNASIPTPSSRGFWSPRRKQHRLPLFDDEFRKKLEYLSIISKRVFAGHFRAERRATRRGTGVEFADYRQYVPGDDFRHLDWKAYLRLNKL